jgi:hypothetical protein
MHLHESEVEVEDCLQALEVVVEVVFGLEARLDLRFLARLAPVYLE